MPVQWTTNPQLTAPAAGSVLLTPPSSLVFSPWVEVAVTDSDWVLTQIYSTVRPYGLFHEIRIELEIGIGAPGSETAVSSISCQPICVAGATTTPRQPPIELPFPLDWFPTGTRISLRMKKKDGDTQPWGWALGYLTKPITGNVQTTTQPYRYSPLVSGGGAGEFQYLGATPGAYGPGDNWVQFIDSCATDLLITHVSVPMGYDNQSAYLRWGVGGAGSESILGTLPIENDIGDGPHCVKLPNPLAIYSQGDRISVRSDARANRGPLTAAVLFGFNYVETPL